MALIPPRFLDTVVAIGFGDDPEKRRWIGTGLLYGLFSHSDAEGRNACRCWTSEGTAPWSSELRCVPVPEIWQ